MEKENGDIQVRVQEMAEEIVKGLGLDVQVKTQLVGNRINLRVFGPDAQLLREKARDGERALAQILEAIFSQQLRESASKDGVPPYRKRELELIARAAAEKALAARQPYVFGPLSAAERRIVHLALAGRQDVTTESRGEGKDRRLVVVPRIQ